MFQFLRGVFCNVTNCGKALDIFIQGGKIGLQSRVGSASEITYRRNPMMRLSNRIAATALAAVMAVSMLTACGGGGGGSTGGNGGGNGGGSGNNGGSTSVAVPAPDKFENVGTGSESEGGGSGTLGTPIASFSGSSRTAKFWSRALTSSCWPGTGGITSSTRCNTTKSS